MSLNIYIMCLEPDMIVYTYFGSQHFGFKINKFVYPENERFYSKNKILDILKTTDLREYKYIIWNYLNKYKCGYGSLKNCTTTCNNDAKRIFCIAYSCSNKDKYLMLCYKCAMELMFKVHCYS